MAINFVFVLISRKKYLLLFIFHTPINHHRGLRHIKFTLTLCQNRVLMPIVTTVVYFCDISHMNNWMLLIFCIYWPCTIKAWYMSNSMSKQGKLSYFCCNSLLLEIPTDISPCSEYTRLPHILSPMSIWACTYIPGIGTCIIMWNTFNFCEFVYFYMKSGH